MMTELCQELRNWFEQKKYFGTFTIEGGQLSVPEGSLQDGQYYRIVGSVFNDGVHLYTPEDTDSLVDEVFDGAIWAMAVPPTVIALSEDIDAWKAKYGGVDSPARGIYQSESFGGYSYSLKSGNSGGSGSDSTASWQCEFASELNRWRKIL